MSITNTGTIRRMRVCSNLVGIFFLILCVVSLPLLVSCAPGSSTKPLTTRTVVARSTPTPTVPAGTVLYQSDWSHGLSAWRPTGHWQVKNGNLQSNLGSENTLTMPYRPTVTNYEVDYRLQVVSVPQPGGYFYLTANPTRGRDGYSANVERLLPPAFLRANAAGQMEVVINPESHMDADTFETHDYIPGTAWKVYKVQAIAGSAIFLIDDIRQSQTVSTQTDTLSNGPIRFVCGDVVLRISSISIIAL